MTTLSLVAFPGRLTITDAVGVPCPGAQLHISAKVEGSRGDAREPMAVYADAAHTIPLPNPVIANDYGLLPIIYLTRSTFDCIASKADCKILWAYFDCKGFSTNATAAPGILFDPTHYEWGDTEFIRLPLGPNGADRYMALGITPRDERK